MTRKRNILIVTAHPDDWECGMGGTALLLKDQYQIHICIVTGGQCGINGKSDEETAGIRAKEAIHSGNLVNAQLHFMNQADGDAQADKAGIDQIVKLLNDLDPVMTFTHWGIDVPDHAVVSNMTRKALYQTGMIHDREIYFFETIRGGQTNQFKPDLYVNITDVKEQKDELIRCHVCQNKDDGLQKTNEEQTRFHGKMARCNYAEPFKTYSPIINTRWDKLPHYSLLDLEVPGLLKPFENNKEVLIIATHPDDWELAMGGTAALMKDQFNIHVLILTRGEGALGKEKSEDCAKLRKEQAEACCKRINASLHIMHFPDGSCAVGNELVDSIRQWADTLNPGIIFLHWPFDKADHAAVATASAKALSLNGMIHDREIYYFGVQQETLKHFDPEFYVNISGVIGTKMELITIHDLPSHKKGELLEGALATNRFHGSNNGCRYAEGFRTHYPLVNHRWNKKTKLSLLKL